MPTQRFIPDNFPGTPPKLKSERLEMRAISTNDAAAYAQMVSPYDYAQMTGSIPHPYNEQMAYGQLACGIGKTARKERLHWAVTDGKTGTFIGDVALFWEAGSTEWALGYGIAHAHHGQGYATEACRTVLDYARDVLGFKRLCAGVYVDNAASCRVLEKLGFMRAGDAKPLFSMARGESAPGYSYGWLAEMEAQSQI